MCHMILSVVCGGANYQRINYVIENVLSYLHGVIMYTPFFWSGMLALRGFARTAECNRNTSIRPEDRTSARVVQGALSCRPFETRNKKQEKQAGHTRQFYKTLNNNRQFHKNSKCCQQKEQGADDETAACGFSDHLRESERAAYLENSQQQQVSKALLSMTNGFRHSNFGLATNITAGSALEPLLRVGSMSPFRWSFCPNLPRGKRRNSSRVVKICF